MFAPHVFSPFGLPLLVYLVNVGAASLAIGAITLAALRVVRSTTPPLRHALGLVGLFVMLAAPLLVALIERSGLSLIVIAPSVKAPNAGTSSADARGTLPGVPRSTAPSTNNASHEGSSTRRSEKAFSPPMPIDPSPAAPQATREAPEDAAAFAWPPFSAASAMRWTALVLALIWILGSLRQAFGLWRGVRHVRLLLRNARLVEDERILDAARAAAAAVGLGRCPRLLASAQVEVPISLGVWRPCVVLCDPPSEAWSAETWRALLVHEMAHLARRDLFVGWLQRWTVVLYWWNPLLRRVSAQISFLREQICDDLVARHAGAADRYAELIVELAARIADRRSLAPALGASEGSPHELALRLRRILNPGRALVTELDARGRLVAATLGIVLAMSISGTSVHLAAAQAADEDQEKSSRIATTPPAEASSAAAVLADTEKNPLLQKRMRVLDQAGQPLAGAAVKPWAMRCSQGHGPWMKNGFGDSDPPVLATDEQGFATISFPKYALAADLVPAQELTCEVSHPDFAANQYVNVPVEGATANQPFTIRLNPGAVITAVAVEGDRRLPMELVRAQWSGQGQQTAKLDAEGRLVLPRVPAGTTLLRLAYFPADGSVWFSPVERITVQDGEHRDLSLTMEPALRVAGRLDESVPRPVKNGRIVSQIILRDDDNFGDRLIWRGCATVEADGSFVLERMPRGDVQVIAICDGFMARSGDAPEFAAEHEKQHPGQNRPQVFLLGDQPEPITIAMTPTAECRVHVVDDSGESVENAKVAFWPNVFWWGGGSQIYCEPFVDSRQMLEDPDRIKNFLAPKDGLYQAQTDAEGNAVVRNLPPTESLFAVTHDELEMPVSPEGNRYSRVELEAGRINEADVSLQPKGTDILGDSVELRAATPTTRIAKPRPKRIVPTAAAADEIAGVVIDEQGQPLAGVTVDAFTWFPGHETTTDAEGRFRIAEITSDTDVEIEFTKEGYSPSLFINRKPGMDDWTIVLTQGTWVEGQVQDQQGAPVPGALVRAVRGPFESEGSIIDEVWTETTADQAGRYRLHLEPYEYAVQCRMPNAGTLRTDKFNLKAKEKKQLDLALEEGTTFVATVRDSVTGRPVEGITLWYWLQPGIEGTSDAEGKLTIDHLPRGEFEFMVTSVDSDRFKSEVAGKYVRWWSDQAAHEWERPEKVDAETFQRNFDHLTFDMQGERVEVEILVEPGVTIKGRIVDPDGKPVVGATVGTAKTGSGNSLTGDTRFSRRTDEQGNFLLTLPASKQHEYNLVAHDGDYQEWRHWANGSGPNLGTTPGQAIEGVELQLQRPGSVRGRVVDSFGEPASGVEVRAAAIDKRDHRYYLPTTKTDQQGSYELRFIAPGEQWIQVEPFYLDASEAPQTRTRKVMVASDRTVDGIDFTLDAASK
ncbi:MAG: carboxypeptidase regulatory-like domain-containing protein [Pirellulales bacterium]|nr:carboxypeptidase regulatory-like domain-containing protein [Pirellulales bacterium]